ncbi:MAG: NAD(P)/FAD-dependent oxidoreductase [Peptoniphilaceae bacterium]|nr:NAD(P)/FAD-dependent oxidoreductase [Peptoniphilaceae bacterium]MDY4196155.1 NAD(P)/FAD-dependent oxidoreductase [Peptoniphilaceae bacterium]
MVKFEKLFEKGKIGSVTLKNRIVMPPMGTGLAEMSGEAGEDIIRYYEERARGGCGLIITEITRIDEENGWGLARQLAATKPGHVGGLQRLADRVHTYGTKVFLQLHHPGREGNSILNPNNAKIVAPSAMTTPVCNEEPHELSVEEAQAIQKEYIKGALIGMSAGVDGVELHAAHGYFLNQWLSPYSNRRTDQYGGSFENRMRYVDEIIRGIRQACGPRFPIGIRLSIEEYMGEEGITKDEGVRIAKHMEEVGVDYIHVSCGIYESGYQIIPMYSFPQGARADLAKAVKEAVNIPVVSINVIKQPELAEQFLEEGICDFVAVGRGQLADPEWGIKAKRGDTKSIRKCIGCNRCIDAVSRGRHLECSVNPRLGFEVLYDRIQENGDGRKVVVIGGGPAGMQTALVLSKRGFDVTLFEKEERLGGVFYIGGLGHGKEKLLWFIETITKEIEASNVHVQLNTEATPELVRELRPEAVFLCVGGKAIVPNIEGIDSDKVIMAEDYLQGRGEVGKKVAVIGSGATGMEVAQTLKSQDKEHEVSLIEMTGTIGASEILRNRRVLIPTLQKIGIELLPNHKLVSITDRGICTELMTEEGGEQEIPCDTVILALGSRPQPDLIKDYEDVAEDVRLYGDAAQVKTILESMREAYANAWTYAVL